MADNKKKRNESSAEADKNLSDEQIKEIDKTLQEFGKNISAQQQLSATQGSASSGSEGKAAQQNRPAGQSAGPEAKNAEAPAPITPPGEVPREQIQADRPKRQQSQAQKPEESQTIGPAPSAAPETSAPSLERPGDQPPQAEPGVAPSYDPGRLDEARKHGELRKQQVEAKKKKKEGKEAGKAKGALPTAAAPGVPGLGKKKKKGLPGVGGGEGGGIDSALALVKKIAKYLLRIIATIASGVCCNPCCWWIILVIGIVLIVFAILGGFG